MSLRLRLLLAVGAVALVALAVADVVTYRSLKSFLYEQVDQSLESAHGGLEHGGGGPGGSRGSDGPGGRGPRPGEATEGAAPGTFVQVRNSAGTVVSSVPAYLPGGTAITPELPARIGGLEGRHEGEPTRYLTVSATQADGPQFRVRVGQFPDGGQLILALPLTNTSATLHRLFLIELVVTFLALVAATGLGWWLVRAGLRPLGEVKRTAGAIAEGQLDRRVPGDDANTEVGEVARALNTMLGRIEGAFAERDATEAELRRSEERLRRFVADASHELRTPLAAVTAYAEMSDRVARDHPEDLDRVMGGIRSESARMGHLVEDLLLLARLDEGLPLERRPVELVALVADAASAARAVGPAWPVELRAALPVEVVGDATRLRQVVDNLLANVRTHTPAGTTARITVGDDAAGTAFGHAAGTAFGHAAGRVLIEVADDGPGLTEEQAGQVFERFYRADPSRSRAHGGTGLGLGIVAAIVAAHGGSVDVVTAPGEGTAMRVHLPVGTPFGHGAGTPSDHERAPSEDQAGLHGPPAGCE